MKLSLMLFIISILLIIGGYANSIKKDCDPTVEIKYVSRNVYDEILKNKVLDIDNDNSEDTVNYNDNN